MPMIDPIDDIKAGFVILLETLEELKAGFSSPNSVGRVFPERSDDFAKTYPAVLISVNGEDMRRTTRRPIGNEIVIDDSDPEKIITGTELLNAQYPVTVCIKATSGEEKRSLSAKILQKVLSVPNGFYTLPSGCDCRIQYHSSDDWEEDEDKGNQKKWKKIWMREITFTVNAAFVAESPETAYIVNEVHANLFVNHDGLSEDNGETITII